MSFHGVTNLLYRKGVGFHPEEDVKLSISQLIAILPRSNFRLVLAPGTPTIAIAIPISDTTLEAGTVGWCCDNDSIPFKPS
jgi:hypothetical protein